MRMTILLAAALSLAACTPPAPKPPEPAVQFQLVSAGKLEHGERVAAVLGCSGCHGAELTGEDWSDPEFGTLWIANLTRAVPNYTDAQLKAVIQSGRRPDRELWGMPSHLFTQLSDADMGALIVFLRSMPPKGVVHPEPAFTERTRQEIAAGKFASSASDVAEYAAAWPPDAGQDHALGHYLVRATCAECHGMDLRGGEPMAGGKGPPDLRIAAAYDLEAFRLLMRTGVAPGERDIGLMGEVARGRYSRFADAEIDAVHAYLKAVAEREP